MIKVLPHCKTNVFTGYLQASVARWHGISCLGASLSLSPPQSPQRADGGEPGVAGERLPQVGRGQRRDQAAGLQEHRALKERE